MYCNVIIKTKVRHDLTIDKPPDAWSESCFEEYRIDHSVEGLHYLSGFTLWTTSIIKSFLKGQIRTRCFAAKLNIRHEIYYGML